MSFFAREPARESVLCFTCKTPSKIKLKGLLLNPKTKINFLQKANPDINAIKKSSICVRAISKRYFLRTGMSDVGTSNRHFEHLRKQLRTTNKESKGLLSLETLAINLTKRDTKRQLSAVAGPKRFIRFFFMLCGFRLCCTMFSAMEMTRFLLLSRRIHETILCFMNCEATV